MKISQIRVENFRLLRKFSLDIEDELSLVIGKNNTGKTSVLTVLDKFLNASERKTFNYNDFNIGFKSNLKKIIEHPDLIDEKDYKADGIRLRILVEYSDKDDLSNISKIMMDLDPASNKIVLGFDYLLHYTEYLALRKDFQGFVVKEKQKVAKKKKSQKEVTNQGEQKTDDKTEPKVDSKTEQYIQKGFHDFLSENLASYFLNIERKSIDYIKDKKYINESNFIDLNKEGIGLKEIINFKFISARRDVTNKDYDKTLSTQTARIYKSAEESAEQLEAVENFKDRLNETDGDLSGIYQTMFKEIISKVKDFGGIKVNDTEIQIISTLQHRELLQDNTTVVYKHDSENLLPEHYNGLGYMNLINMIFEIEILMEEFKRPSSEKPADINLLFIEEPEAHTHPQMQYIFIKNIKALLKKGVNRSDGQRRILQYIISTHSSCIVADSDFDDIKYLRNEKNEFVVAKNLKDLKATYAKNEYHFLTQYLTISRAEIFFADKAVLIEGDTERMLIPTFMRKLDLEHAKLPSDQQDGLLPLLSQNISVIEVGAYSQIFELFIEFLGIQTLIITDLDAVGVDKKACRVADGVGYSNSALEFFYASATLAQLQGYDITKKRLKKQPPNWVQDATGSLCVIYQTIENGYNARSFEDAFIHLNRAWVTAKKDDFKGIKNAALLDDATKDSYELAERCIKKKTHFALDIVYYSDKDFSNWEIPGYIKEGLLWLKQN